jgi:hypothetical protein
MHLRLVHDAAYRPHQGPPRPAKVVVLESRRQARLEARRKQQPPRSAA